MTDISNQRDRPSVLRRIVWVLGWFELVAAVAAFSAGVSISAAQILLRYATGASIWWSQEVSLLLMITSYFLGAGVVFRMRAYVVVDSFMNLFPRSAQFAVYVFAQFAVLAFWGIILWELIWMSPDALRTYTAIMRLPKLYFNIPLIIASTSIALTTILVLASIRSANARTDGSIADLEEKLAILPGRSS